MIFSLRQLAPLKDHDLATPIQEVASVKGHRQVFNPTFARVKGTQISAYRAVPSVGGPIRSYLWVHDGGTSRGVTDLTAIGATQGVVRVADPKVFVAGEEAYVTFNTGFARPGSRNEIYVMRVFPDVGPMQRVVARFDRQRVEKNWGFFAAEGAPLRAIYRLHPYEEVELASGQLGQGEDLEFVKRVPAQARSSAANGLTIGTQPLYGERTAQLIAHERWSFRWKRMYFGRAVKVEGVGSDSVVVSVSRGRLIHRWRDMLPRKRQHNRNLLAATYFSALMRDAAGVVLGYGINDVSFSVARLDERDLWS